MDGETLFELPPVLRPGEEGIYTVGHSRHSLEEFLGLLRAHRITVVVDVRAYRASRRHPWFGESSLRESLSLEGLCYLPDPDLGGQRKANQQSLNTVWEDGGLRAYADHMETEAFGAAARRLVETSKKQRLAVMCAESTWWHCHRMMIADYLKAGGHSVFHIVDARVAQPHPYSQGARASSLVGGHYARTVLGLRARLE